MAWRGCEPCRLPALQMVEQQFQHLFPGKVLRVHMAHDTRELDSLVREYWKLRRRLLDLLDDYSNKRKHGRAHQACPGETALPTQPQPAGNS